MYFLIPQSYLFTNDNRSMLAQRISEHDISNVFLATERPFRNIHPFDWIWRHWIIWLTLFAIVSKHLTFDYIFVINTICYFNPHDTSMHGQQIIPSDKLFEKNASVMATTFFLCSFVCSLRISLVYIQSLKWQNKCDTGDIDLNTD